MSRANEGALYLKVRELQAELAEAKACYKQALYDGRILADKLSTLMSRGEMVYENIRPAYLRVTAGEYPIKLEKGNE